MTTFEIYIKNNSENKAVKQGWSWPAFIFGSIWALCMQLWLIGLVLFPVELVLTVVRVSIELTDLDDDLASTRLIVWGMIVLFEIAIRIAFGTNGNGWKRRRLEQVGYKLATVINAGSKEAALATYRQTGSPVDITYRLVIKGVRDGVDQALVPRQLAKLLGTDEDHAQQLIASYGVTIKKGLDLKSVPKYQQSIEATGVIVGVEPENEEILKFDLPESRPLPWGAPSGSVYEPVYEEHKTD